MVVFAGVVVRGDVVSVFVISGVTVCAYLFATFVVCAAVVVDVVSANATTVGRTTDGDLLAASEIEVSVPVVVDAAVASRVVVGAKVVPSYNNFIKSFHRGI